VAGALFLRPAPPALPLPPTARILPPAGDAAGDRWSASVSLIGAALDNIRALPPQQPSDATLDAVLTEVRRLHAEALTRIDAIAAQVGPAARDAIGNQILIGERARHASLETALADFATRIEPDFARLQESQRNLAGGLETTTATLASLQNIVRDTADQHTHDLRVIVDEDGRLAALELRMSALEDNVRRASNNRRIQLNRIEEDVSQLSQRVEYLGDIACAGARSAAAPATAHAPATQASPVRTPVAPPAGAPAAARIADATAAPAAAAPAAVS
jgi:hypothetical protein